MCEFKQDENFIPIIKNTKDYVIPELCGMTVANNTINHETINEFENIILKGGETEIHNFLLNNPYFLRPALEFRYVGHHGMWYHSKPQIRPRLTNGKKGKIPDFILCGDGSGGKEWFIVELKSPQDMLFNGTAFSNVANKGLNQLAEYLIFATEKQSHIRDALEIKDFKTPYGIFIIGNEQETIGNELQQSLKSFWKSNMNRIIIMSYSNLLNQCKHIMQFNQNIHTYEKGTL